MTFSVNNLKYRYAVNLLEKYRDLEKQVSISRSSIGYEVLIE